MICRAALTALFCGIALPAWAQDGGVPDGGGGCGMVTFEGECNGNVVVYCDTDTDTVQMIDCEVDIDPNAVCTEIEPTYGVDCALPVGDACTDEDGNIYFCQGTAPGCFEDPTGAICAENIGPCVEADIDTCRGSQWVFECAVNQPYIVDCGAYGGQCGDRPGRCFDLPAGSFCGDSFECVAGTTCGSLGLCVSNPDRDAGVAERDSGTMAPRDGGVSTPVKTPANNADDSSCTCVTTPLESRTGWFVLFPLLFLGLRSRASRTARASRASSR